jgi:Asp-tRNA(Asn)/Glu-tRNA(Gln) amidotransferase A subunit family amidase
MERRDLLILPTVAVTPFPVEQPYPTEINGKPLDNYTQWFFLTYGITVTGLPAISVPCGFTRSGLPVGLQIVGRRRQEATVLRAAAAFEAAAPWADKIPPVVSVPA